MSYVAAKSSMNYELMSDPLIVFLSDSQKCDTFNQDHPDVTNAKCCFHYPRSQRLNAAALSSMSMWRAVLNGISMPVGEPACWLDGTSCPWRLAILFPMRNGSVRTRQSGKPKQVPQICCFHDRGTLSGGWSGSGWRSLCLLSCHRGTPQGTWYKGCFSVGWQM